MLVEPALCSYNIDIRNGLYLFLVAEPLCENNEKDIYVCMSCSMLYRRCGSGVQGQWVWFFGFIQRGTIQLVKYGLVSQ